MALVVVDDLRGDVPQRTGDHQAGTLGGAAQPLADAEVPAGSADATRRRGAAEAAPLEQFGGHFLPAFPAFRRMASPWYRTPLPLYGSGGRIFLMFAATSPTCCLSIPDTWNSVG